MQTETDPDMNNKFELKFFKRNIGKSPDKHKTGIKSPLNRVKIAAPYAYVEVSVANNSNYSDFDIFCKKSRTPLPIFSCFFR